MVEDISASVSTSNSQFKIAPTKRDSRKLFVGGLPSEGMHEYVISD